MTNKGESTVQVPVSLIEQLPHAPLCRYDRTDALAYRGERANCDCWKSEVLSQPTPSAEPKVTPEQRSWQARMLRDAARNTRGGAREWLLRRADWFENPPLVGIAAATAEPPRIEDMAPGTTFTEASGGWPRTAWTVGQRHDGTKYAKRQSDGWVLDPKCIDPSTIRDVTPPKEQS
jgi:hypothetical protein